MPHPKLRFTHLTEEEYRQLAKDEWAEDGELEIGADATVSMSDDGGAYVQAWVWVEAPDRRYE